MRWQKIKQNTNIGKKKSKICQIGMKVSDCLTVELWEYGAKRSDNEAVMSGQSLLHKRNQVTDL